MLRTPFVHDPRGHVIPVVALRKPHPAGCKPRDAVRRLADHSGQYVVAEHELLRPYIGFLALRMAVVQRPADGYARVVCLPGRRIDVRGQVISQPDSLAHRVEVIREHPETLLHRHILCRMGLVDRREDSRLHPARVKLRIGARHSGRLHVSAYVMPPVAVADIRCSGGEIRQVAQHFPCGEGVPGEAHLIAVASDSAPSVIDHRPRSVYTHGRGLSHLVLEEHIVQPEGVAQSLRVVAVLPLLPVLPPEVHPVTLQRMDDRIEIGVRPLYLVHPERYRRLRAVFADIPLRTVVVVRPGQIVLHEPLIRLFVWLYPVAEMQVQGILYPHTVQFLQKVGRIREQLLLPCIARPADTLAEFVQARFPSRFARRCGRLEFGPGLVPVHVDDHHIYRNAEVLEMSGQVDEFEIGILPISAPPVAKGVFWRERYPSRNLREVA